MKSPLLLIGILYGSLFVAQAQTIEITRQSDFVKQTNPKDFAFIEATTNLSAFEFVAQFKVTGSRIDALYTKAMKKARDLGGNSFFLADFLESDNQSILVIDIYHGQDSIMDINFANHEKNVVYIFGNEKKSDATKVNFKLNDVRQEFNSGTFYRHEIQKGQEVKISKGGLTGAAMWINWREDKPATFLTLTGFGLGGGQPANSGVGITFNTGRINYIDGNLGHLLVEIMSD